LTTVSCSNGQGTGGGKPIDERKKHEKRGGAGGRKGEVSAMLFGRNRRTKRVRGEFARKSPFRHHKRARAFVEKRKEKKVRRDENRKGKKRKKPSNKNKRRSGVLQLRGKKTKPLFGLLEEKKKASFCGGREKAIGGKRQKRKKSHPGRRKENITKPVALHAQTKWGKEKTRGGSSEERKEGRGGEPIFPGREMRPAGSEKKKKRRGIKARRLGYRSRVKKSILGKGGEEGKCLKERGEGSRPSGPPTE